MPGCFGIDCAVHGKFSAVHADNGMCAATGIKNAGTRNQGPASGEAQAVRQVAGQAPNSVVNAWCIQSALRVIQSFR